MAARLTRAKKKIAVARIPYRVPEPEEMRTRIDAVLTVIHLLFTTGHTAPSANVSRATISSSVPLISLECSTRCCPSTPRSPDSSRSW